ncbi:hypothetical protein K6327_000890 [Vibrio vulnificus]|nr:hypothetical protein [Vibrio vulnificus]
MNIKPEFCVGEKVFLVAKPNDVTFDDRLPVVEMVIDKIKFDGNIDADGSSVVFSYFMHEVGSFSLVRDSPANMFKSEQEANEVARALLNSMKDKTQKRLTKISAMLDRYE